jgi:hypothetical protein
MADNKKFLFDLNNFDIDLEAEKKKKPKEPTFSLKDMEEARSAAFEKGKAEGIQIAKDSLEQRTEILVQSIAQNITVLEQAESQRQAAATQDALILVYKTLKSLIPSLWDIIAEDDIKRFLTDFFSKTVSKGEFQLFVNPSMTDAIKPHAQNILSTIIVSSDDTLALNAARIEWAKGHAAFTPEETAAKILKMIEDHITEKSELLDESQKKPHNEENISDSEEAPHHE